MNTNEANGNFDNREVGPGTGPANPRTYDVRITLNKSSKSNGFVVRFGFLNEAVKAFNGKTYIQASKVETLPNRIYFRLLNERTYIGAHKLCTNSKAETSNLYMSFTPSEAAEKIFRAKWVGKTFKIKYDEECEHYYIEQEAE